MSSRDIRYKQQIKYSMIFKVLSILMSFFIIRYVLNYIGVDKYGVWSVILVFINWIVFFDFGFSNGIKNKVATCLATGKKKAAQEYISTGYVLLGIFIIILYLIFFLFSHFINWQNIFNIYTISNYKLMHVLQTISFFLLLNFMLTIISGVFQAVQQASLVVFNQFLSQFLSLIMVLLLIKFTSSSLLFLSIVYGLALVSSNIIMSFWFYSKYAYLKPSIKDFKMDKIKPITSLGMNFFFLQITILAIMSSDKMIITQLLGPSYVTNYDILFKYFTVISILHSTINAPLWSIYTEAYKKNDYVWIERTLKKILKIIFLYILLGLILTLLGDYIIKLWLNNSKISISLSNYIYMGCLVIFLAWYSIFAYFTNGIGQINVQLYSSLFGAAINIPLSIYLVNYQNMGLNGVMLATIISLSIFCILGPIQAIGIINKMKLQKCEHEHAV